jgi:hypothetical protein
MNLKDSYLIGRSDGMGSRKVIKAIGGTIEAALFLSQNIIEVRPNYLPT